MLRILIVGLVLLVAAMMLLPRGADGPRGVDQPAITTTATLLDAPRELPDIALTDTRGEPFSLDDLAGRYTLLFFGFTNCPDICPLTLAALDLAVEQIRDEAPELAPEVLFVSVDPARDTPEQIETYLARFDERFVGATTSEPGLEPLTSTLGVMVHKQNVGDEVYNVVHNGTVFVLDDEGRWIALFGGSSHLPDVIASDYLAIRQNR